MAFVSDAYVLYDALKKRQYKIVEYKLYCGHVPCNDFLFHLYELMANIDEIKMPEAQSFFFIVNHVLVCNYYRKLFAPAESVGIQLKMRQKLDYLVSLYPSEKHEMMKKYQPSFISNVLF